MSQTELGKQNLTVGSYIIIHIFRLHKTRLKNYWFHKEKEIIILKTV